MNFLNINLINLNSEPATRRQGLKGGRVSIREIAPRNGSRALTAALLLLLCGGVVKAEQNKLEPQPSISSRPVVIDLDQPARYTYKSEVVKRIPIGSKAGEIGIKTQADMSFEGPDSAALDRAGNLYVHDLVNRRIEVFDRSGKFKEIAFRYSNVVPQFPASRVALDWRGHVYLNLILLHNGEGAYWEISRNGILKKYSQPIVPNAWSGQDISIVTVATQTAAGAEVFISSSVIKQKQFSFRTTRGLQQFDIVLITHDHVFFRVDTSGQKFLIQLNLKQDSFRRINNSSVLYVQDGSQYVDAGISSDGSMYVLRLDEPSRMQ
jgi:hypothetical protein